MTADSKAGEAVGAGSTGLREQNQKPGARLKEGEGGREEVAERSGQTEEGLQEVGGIALSQVCDTKINRHSIISTY